MINMIDITLIMKIAMVGILTAVLDKLLTSLGRDEQATLVTLAGLVVISIMVLGLINKLFDSVKTMFQF
jgi:stage III sporulation protein AC